jgi:5-hydroxyisourate hydrolase
MVEQPTISTHVIDADSGRPAPGIEVVLWQVDGAAEREAGRGVTDEDGRIRRLLMVPLEVGTYRLEFRLDRPFYRAASITFAVDETSRTYHVPVLVAPFSLTTYRGS